MNFDPTWPHGHVTRNGEWYAEILRSDTAGGATIVALLTNKKTKGQFAWMYEANGRDPDCLGGEFDLLNAPAPKRKIWANIYGVSSYDSKEEADATAALFPDNPRFACIEVEEDQGLEGVK